ncbi:hypothetical protein E4419_05695 [Stenotrophomonas maltophilia]|nr:hypothetical protein E4419_05695 [Stenotrophomonas maltophilia]
MPCAQDCAHEQAATEPPWTDSRRPPQSDPPRHLPVSQLLLLLRLAQVQGCKPCITNPTPLPR